MCSNHVSIRERILLSIDLRGIWKNDAIKKRNDQQNVNAIHTIVCDYHLGVLFIPEL